MVCHYLFRILVNVGFAELKFFFFPFFSSRARISLVWLKIYAANCQLKAFSEAYSRRLALALVVRIGGGEALTLEKN